MLFLKSKILKDNAKVMLFLKSKILSLKGTHNCRKYTTFFYMVVSKVKDTKFERNSQLVPIVAVLDSGCF